MLRRAAYPASGSDVTFLRGKVGVVAPSFVVPPVEFALGIERLRKAGFAVQVHPQCAEQKFLFAGSDEARASGFWEYATDDTVSVVWCGRGGYGAVRILRFLEEQTRKHGKPAPKLLVGYSDATALLEYTRSRWGWSTLHAPMPAVREFSELPPSVWQALVQWVSGAPEAHFAAKLKPVVGGAALRRPLTARLVGGNLSLWASLLGTPYAPKTRGDILFFEDIGETPYRLDRMIQQLAEARIFDTARALVLGTFQDCADATSSALKLPPPSRGPVRRRMLRTPQSAELRPLRPLYSPTRWQREIFGGIGERFGIPVWRGLPVGHGRAGFTPMPIGATYRLSPDGVLKLVEWESWERWRAPKRR